MGRLLGGTGKCDWLIDTRVYPLFEAAKQTKIASDDCVQIPHIVNGLWLLKMMALACTGLVFAVYGRKLTKLLKYLNKRPILTL